MRFRWLTILLCTAVAGACSSTSPSNDNSGGVTNLQITDVRVGTGTEATSGRTITVHYTGWVYSTTAAGHKGAQFDTSRTGGPFIFVLGTGRVIAGWDQGIVGMRVGGQRTLIIPPNLAYGNRSQTGIPANSTLVFDVELLSVT